MSAIRTSEALSELELIATKTSGCGYPPCEGANDDLAKHHNASRVRDMLNTGPGLGLLRQHLLNHQRTSQILCLPSSHSFQAYASKPMRGHVMGKTKSGEASRGATYHDVALTPCSR